MQTPAIFDEVKETLSMVQTQREVLEIMVEYGKGFEELSADKKTEANKVPGCVSNVFIEATLKEGKIQFEGSSDAHIVRGYVAILIQALNGLTPQEVIEEAGPVVEKFIEESNLNTSMIASRANAFGNVFAKMKEQAAKLI